MLTIETWNFNYVHNDHEIDVINRSIHFEETKNKVNIVGIGTNGIGRFNFSYRVKNFDSKEPFECSIDSVTTTVTNPLPTSCICNANVPSDDRTDQPLEETSVTTSIANPLPTSSTCIASVPVDNSTNQPLAVSSSSLWALIAVAIMLLLTLFVTIIIAICIVKNMSMKLKETKERNGSEPVGEHSYMSSTSSCIFVFEPNNNYTNVCIIFSVRRQIQHF